MISSKALNLLNHYDSIVPKAQLVSSINTHILGTLDVDYASNILSARLVATQLRTQRRNLNCILVSQSSKSDGYEKTGVPCWCPYYWYLYVRYFSTIRNIEQVSPVTAPRM
jgi:hypothetical protein